MLGAGRRSLVAADIRPVIGHRAAPSNGARSPPQPRYAREGRPGFSRVYADGIFAVWHCGFYDIFTCRSIILKHRRTMRGDFDYAMCRCAPAPRLVRRDGCSFPGARRGLGADACHYEVCAWRMSFATLRRYRSNQQKRSNKARCS